MTTKTRKQPVSIALQLGAANARLLDLTTRRNQLWLDRERNDEWERLTEEITATYRELRRLRKLARK